MLLKNRRYKTLYVGKTDRVFSYDVRAAILVFQNKETAARSVPLGIKLYIYANIFFCFISKAIWSLVT